MELDEEDTAAKVSEAAEGAKTMDKVSNNITKEK